MIWPPFMRFSLRKVAAIMSSSLSRIVRASTARYCPISSSFSGNLTDTLDATRRSGHWTNRMDSNWTQIPFTLLFGIATSVELLQNRLRKSVCEYIQGTEFDVTQGTSVLEEIILKVAVTSPDIPLLIGGPLLESMIKRQHEKVAGVQDFISALKVNLFSWQPSPSLACRDLAAILTQARV